MKAPLALASFAALLAAASGAASAPAHSYGFGARATALGGAVTGDDGDAASLFYNPASLARAPQSQLLVGYHGVSPALNINFRDAGVPGVGSWEGAALGRGSFLGVPVGFGLGFALSNGHLSRVESLRHDEARWALRNPLPELFDLSAGLSAAPWRWLALGAGAGFLATTRGTFQVTGTATLADGNGAEYDSQLRHAVDAELTSVRFPVFGAELRLPPLLAGTRSPLDLRLGLSYRGEARLEQQLRGELSGTVDAGFAQVPVRYTFDAQSLLAFQPRQVVLGVSARSGPQRLNVDIGFEQWSRYPSPVARSGAHVEADVPFGLPLTLPPDSELPPATDAGFSDRLTWRFGFERTLALPGPSSGALRAGYAYLPTPAPRNAPNDEIMDAPEHVFALGGGVRVEPGEGWWRLPCGFALDAFGLYGHLPKHRLDRRGGIFFADGHTLSAGVTFTLLLAGPSHAGN